MHSSISGFSAHSLSHHPVSHLTARNALQNATVSRLQNRHLRSDPATLGVTPLEPGEHSKPIRVRGSEPLFAWLAEHSPAQIGQMLEQQRVQTFAGVDDELELVVPTPRYAVPAKVKLSPVQRRTLEALLPDGYIYRDPGSERNRPYYLVGEGRFERVEVGSTAIALLKKKLLASHDVYGLPHRPRLEEWRTVYRLSDAARDLIASA